MSEQLPAPSTNTYSCMKCSIKYQHQETRKCLACKVILCENCSTEHNHQMPYLHLSELIEALFNSSNLDKKYTEPEYLYSIIFFADDNDILDLKNVMSNQNFNKLLLYRFIISTDSKIKRENNSSLNMNYENLIPNFEIEYEMGDSNLNVKVTTPSQDFSCRLMALPDTELRIENPKDKILLCQRKFCYKCECPHIFLPDSLISKHINFSSSLNETDCLKFKLILSMPEDEKKDPQQSKSKPVFEFLKLLFAQFRIFRNYDRSTINFFISIVWISNFTCLFIGAYPLVFNIYLFIIFLGSYRIMEKDPKYYHTNNCCYLITYLVLLLILWLICDFNFLKAFAGFAIILLLFLLNKMNSYVNTANDEFMEQITVISDSILVSLFSGLDSDRVNTVHENLYKKKLTIIEMKKNIMLFEISTSMAFIYSIIIMLFYVVYPSSVFGILLSSPNSGMKYYEISDTILIMWCFILFGISALINKVKSGFKVNNKIEAMMLKLNKGEELLSLIYSEPLVIVCNQIKKSLLIDDIEFDIDRLPKMYLEESTRNVSKSILVIIFRGLEAENKAEYKEIELERSIEKMTLIFNKRIELIKKELKEMRPFMDYKLLGIFTINKSLIYPLALTGVGTLLTSIISYIQSNSIFTI